MGLESVGVDRRLSTNQAMNLSDLNGAEHKMIAATLALRLRTQPFTPDQTAVLDEAIAEGIRAASGAVVSIEHEPE